MEQIKIQVFHTGEVCVSPYLPFGGDECNIIKASGLTTPKRERLWLPVSAYFISHPKGKILVDCGWHREMSPNGVYDKKAQIASMGSPLLYMVNQGKIEKGAAIDEQLARIGLKPSDLDYVLLTHLDCDHANGVELVRDAKHIMVSNEEIQCSRKNGVVNRIRYQQKWWKNCNLEAFEWNDTEGPFGEAYDLLGDGSVKMIHIPGHCDGLCAVKVRNAQGKYVLLFSDGGYATRSWRDMVTSGVCMNKTKQRTSLEWIRRESMNENCVESLANHDTDVIPHTIIL